MAAARARRVAVVGGGPAGLASCRLLAEVGHEPVLFEAGSQLGGIWAPKPTNNVVYRGLVTNIPTVAMQSFDFAFEKGLPSYVTGEQLGRYFVQYATHFGLDRFVRFGARVHELRPLRSEADEVRGDAAWRVSWASAEGGELKADDFDAVVVASGHYDEPFTPEVPGQAEWLAAAPRSRRVSHAREYDEPSQYAGRVVLVVGGRSSAVDIARELRGVVPWLYVLEGGCKDVRTDGSCTHVPLGTKLTVAGRLELEGREVAGLPVDDVVLATGYKFSFPFLDCEGLDLDLGTEGRYVAPLYQHVLHARRPSLCFVGLPKAVPCPLLLFEAQARFVAAQLLTCNSSTEEREAWVQERMAQSRPQDLQTLGGEAWNYTREVVRLAGMPDYETYCRRLALVEAVYQDRVDKRPELPWGDDWYRRCEYKVNWEAGSWTVTPPAEARM